MQTISNGTALAPLDAAAGDQQVEQGGGEEHRAGSFADELNGAVRW
jgi:hypothetical protein